MIEPTAKDRERAREVFPDRQEHDPRWTFAVQGMIAQALAEARAEVERLRGLLRRVTDKMLACNGWHMDDVGELADEADAALREPAKPDAVREARAVYNRVWNEASDAEPTGAMAAGVTMLWNALQAEQEGGSDA